MSNLYVNHLGYAAVTKRLVLLLFTLAFIAGCSSGGDSTSSSSVSSSETSSVQSSSSESSDSSSANASHSSSQNTQASQLTGDPQRGAQLFEQGLCAGCHGNRGGGTASTGNNVIDMNHLLRTEASFAVLADYIENEMPDNSAEGCVSQCAADTASYLLSWLAPASSQSSNSSQSNSSSSTPPANGMALYQTQCQHCHGEQGNGSTQIIADNWSLDTLQSKIHNTMPSGDSELCQDDCATAIAQYILTWQTTQNCSQPEQLLPRRLRLLTPREYQLTINDLFDLNRWNNIAGDLPITETVRGYDNNVPEISISNAHVTQYWAAAEVLSETVDVNELIDCNGLSQEACASQWVSGLGKQAFRRPLTSEEEASYTELFLTEGNTTEAKRLTLKAFMMSPNFIYRSEMGVEIEPGVFQLTPYETASLLSYTYQGTMPDDTLMSAADNNLLQTPQQIQEQVERLLADNLAADQMVHFAKQWLEATNVRYIAKDGNLFPDFNGQVSVAMDDELGAFISDQFLSGQYTFKDLYTADYVFVNSILANFYGINGVSSSDLVATPANAQRGGILNLGAVLASHAKMNQTSPIARGVFVRERLLCQTFPAPPPNAGDVIPLDNSLSTRERFSAHTDNDGCRSCHEKIDPIGFSFERYDATGKYRETEGNNLAVDDSGSITGMQRMSDGDYWPYQGTQGLSALLADSTHAAACLAEQYQTFVQGVAQPDSCTISQLVSEWSNTNYQLYDLWIHSALQSSFILRQGETP